MSLRENRDVGRGKLRRKEAVLFLYVLDGVLLSR